ncbi:MAG: hypothetical protein Q8M31_09525 [Beijerinckiaceae bacterium]|nr:hypothetical protein [Beijerinckiaceae bacterium]
MSTNFAFISAFALAALASASPSRAQLQLPGAVQGHAPTQGDRAPQAPLPGVAVRAPVETGLLGRELRQNGVHGLINFQRQGETLAVSRLVLSGERISNRRETCRVEVEGGPFTATPQSRLGGLKRYAVTIPACPFTFVVLDAAILANVSEGAAPVQPSASTRPDNRAGNTAGMCAFTQADCVVHIGGVWGPTGSSISKGDLDQVLKSRSAAEKNALANYRALISQAGGDRQKIRAIAAEQASFSSKRAEQCSDYDREEVHGFCSARVTEARAVALRAQLNPTAFESENNAPERKPPPRPRPAVQSQQQNMQPPGAPFSLGR